MTEESSNATELFLDLVDLYQLAARASEEEKKQLVEQLLEAYRGYLDEAHARSHQAIKQAITQGSLDHKAAPRTQLRCLAADDQQVFQVFAMSAIEHHLQHIGADSPHTDAVQLGQWWQEQLEYNELLRPVAAAVAIKSSRDQQTKQAILADPDPGPLMIRATQQAFLG